MPSYPQLIRSRLVSLGVATGVWVAVAWVAVPRLPKPAVISRRLAGLVQPTGAGVWVSQTQTDVLLPVADYQVVRSYLDPNQASVLVVWRARNRSHAPLEVRLDDLLLTNPQTAHCRFRAGALDQPPVLLPPQTRSGDLQSIFAMRAACLHAHEPLQLQPKLPSQPRRPAWRRAWQELRGMRLRVVPQPTDEDQWRQLLQKS